MSNIIKSHISIVDSSETIKLAPIYTHKVKKNTNEEVRPFVTEEEIIKKANMEADAIKQHANIEREKMLQQLEIAKQNWEIEKEELKKTAYDEGYNFGYIAGEKEALQHYKSIIEEANEIVKTSKEDYVEKINSSQTEIISIAVKIAEKIIAQKLDSNNDSFVNFVTHAIKEVKEKEEIKIFVHPNKFDLLLENKQNLKNIVHNLSDIYIFADADLQENSCWIDSSAGRMDVSIDTQLTIIKDKLTQFVQQKEDK